MHRFTDAAGREWRLEITQAVIKRCLGDTGIDLRRAYTDQNLAMLRDPFQIADVVWSMIEKQAAENTIDQDDFDAALDGTTFEAMGLALRDELTVFFRAARPELANSINLAEQKMRLSEKMIAEKYHKKVEDIDIVKLVEDLMTQENGAPKDGTS